MNIKYRKAELTLVAGQTSVDKPLSLPQGECRAMTVFNPKAGPDEIVELHVLDNGADLIEPMDYRLSEKTTHGRFLDSWRQMSFDCGRDTIIRITTAVALAADVKVQVVFAIITK